NSLADGVTPRLEHFLAGKRFRRALEIDEQPTGLADEVIERGQIPVEAHRAAARPCPQTPLRDEQLQVAINSPRGDPRELPTHLMDRFRRRVRPARRHRRINQPALARVVGCRRGSHISNRTYYWYCQSQPASKVLISAAAIPGWRAPFEPLPARRCDLLGLTLMRAHQAVEGKHARIVGVWRRRRHQRWPGGIFLSAFRDSTIRICTRSAASRSSIGSSWKPWMPKIPPSPCAYASIAASRPRSIPFPDPDYSSMQLALWRVSSRGSSESRGSGARRCRPPVRKRSSSASGATFSRVAR